ncbi:MAG: hypothetical protein QXU81_00030 [Candidatus Bathyarchaeia archaeon]
MDKEIVDALKESRSKLGEIYPILIDYDGEILSGSHRKAAGWTKIERIDSREIAEKLKLPLQMAKLLIKMHTNIQRKPTIDETRELLLDMAECLEKSGVPTENVSVELAKYVPYSRDYIRDLLPEKYKLPHKVEAGKKTKETLKSKKEQETAGMIPAKESLVFEKEQETTPVETPSEDIEVSPDMIDLFFSDSEGEDATVYSCPCSCGWSVEVNWTKKTVSWLTP